MSSYYYICPHTVIEVFFGNVLAFCSEFEKADIHTHSICNSYVCIHTHSICNSYVCVSSYLVLLYVCPHPVT